MLHKLDYLSAKNAWKDIIALKINHPSNVFHVLEGTTALMEQRILMITHVSLEHTTMNFEKQRKRIAYPAGQATIVHNGVRNC